MFAGVMRCLNCKICHIYNKLLKNLWLSFSWEFKVIKQRKQLQDLDDFCLVIKATS